MPASKLRASSCIIAATFCFLSPSAGTGISLSTKIPQRSPSYHRIAGNRAAPVRSASAAEPTAMRAFSPKNSTSMPGAGDVPVGDQADQLARAQPLGQGRERADGPPLAGSTSKPSLSRNATNSS